MSFLLILAVLLSGLIHATWNFFGKKSGDKFAYFYLVKISQSIIYLPIVAYIISKEPVRIESVPYIIMGGLIHIAYWYYLSQSYTYEDLSVVYPIARSAPALIPIFSFISLGERLALGGILGIVLVSIGVYLLTFENGKFKETLKRISNFKEKGILFSYITLFTVIAFSLNDKKASGLVNPVAYVYLFETISLLGLTPILFLTGKQLLLKNEIKVNFFSIALSGIMIILSYSLTIFAMKYSPVSYVTSVRQIGIVFGVLYGVIFLKESYGLRRISASIAIALGIIAIGLFG